MTKLRLREVKQTAQLVNNRARIQRYGHTTIKSGLCPFYHASSEHKLCLFQFHNMVVINILLSSSGYSMVL